VLLLCAGTKDSGMEATLQLTQRQRYKHNSTQIDAKTNECKAQQNLNGNWLQIAV
jgi:hypothetical protein